MLQFVQGGPAIPEELLRARDEERLVFFCGSGISKPTGLPLFGELADLVWTLVQPAKAKSPAEEAAIEKGNYDRFLGLLERRLVPGTVRRHVIDSLLKPYSGPPIYHESLLKLASLRNGGLRLVTTNFDHRFIEAGCERSSIDTAPKLPVPKPGIWNTLVCIHGLIDKERDPNGQGLVLTSADFGRAYLSEGWASRFLTDLFREFTVVFLGYSIDDPIVSYLMSALAGERALATHYKEAYAFASFDGTDANRSHQDANWRSKDVIPILYDGRDRHQLLVDTLNEWSKLVEGENNYKNSILSNCLLVAPKDSSDILSRQACWALYDERGTAAKQFATASELAPLEWWIDVFDQYDFELHHPSKVKVKLSELPISCPLLSTDVSKYGVALVSRGNTSSSPLHPVTYWLTYWLCRHLGNRRLLDWVLAKGDRLHPTFRYLVRDALSTAKIEDDGLRQAWTVLTTPAIYHSAVPNFWDRQTLSLSDAVGLSLLGKLELTLNLTPTLVLGAASSTMQDVHSTNSIRHFLEGDIDLVCGEDLYSIDERLEKESERAALLSDFAEQASNLLEYTIDLFSLIGKADSTEDPTYLEIQSISPHPQNEHSKKWVKLVELARDCFSYLLERDSVRATKILNLWASKRYPVFKRLLLHVITEHQALDTKLACEILMQNDGEFLWSLCTRRECLRFLRKAGTRIDQDSLNKLEAMLDGGPPRSKYRSDLTSEEFEESKAVDSWIRLSKLHASGAILHSRIISNLETVAEERGLRLDANHEDELLFVIGEPRWVSEYEDVNTKILERISVKEFLDSYTNESEVSRTSLQFLASHRPAIVRRFLLALGNERKWNVEMWRMIVQGLDSRGSKSNTRRVWLLFAQFISEMPDEALEPLANLISSYLRHVSVQLKPQDISQFLDCFERTWRFAVHIPVNDLTEPLTYAINHPLGRLTEAFLLTLKKGCKLEKGAGFPSPFMKLLNDIANTTGKQGVVCKCILGAELPLLCWQDESWTVDALINDMNWSDPMLSSAIWNGYLWQFRIFPDLLLLLKPSLVGLFANFSFFRDTVAAQFVDQIFRFLGFALVDGRSCFQSTELHRLGLSMDSNSLGRLGHALAKRLELHKAPSALYDDSVKPLLADLWPTDASFQSSESSNGLAHIAILADESFPHAVSSMEHFYRRSTHFGGLLNKIAGKEIGSKFPKELTHLLALCISAESQHWERSKLPTVLEQIANSWGDCATDPEFIYLSQIGSSGV